MAPGCLPQIPLPAKHFTRNRAILLFVSLFRARPFTGLGSHRFSCFLNIPPPLACSRAALLRERSQPSFSRLFPPASVSRQDVLINGRQSGCCAYVLSAGWDLSLLVSRARSPINTGPKEAASQSIIIALVTPGPSEERTKQLLKTVSDAGTRLAPRCSQCECDIER